MERVHQRRAHGHHGHPGSLRFQRRLANQSKYPVSFHSLLFRSPGVSLPSRDAGASLCLYIYTATKIAIGDYLRI